MSKDSKSLGGTVIEAGKANDGNFVDIEVAPGQKVVCFGLSDDLTKWLAAHLYDTVTVEFTREYK